MKNVFHSLFAVLVLILFSACAKELITPTQSTVASEDLAKGYRIDTIITFDVETFEETIEIVKTKIEEKNNRN